MTGAERFLALGDSFTIGTGTSPDRSFPAILVGLWREARRSVALTNPAVNGYATDDLIAEELPLVAQVRPTLVTVLIGANDIVRAVGPDGYRERLARIYAHLRAHAPRARVVALPQPDWSMSPAAVEFGDVAAIAREIERFNEIARAEGERSGARWIDLFPLMREQARRGMFAADGLHPSASAHAEWARELARAWAW